MAHFFFALFVSARGIIVQPGWVYWAEQLSLAYSIAVMQATKQHEGFH